ncbi:MAG TPA: hypothetical protein VK473_06310 [Terriglobales bacterium]|nr:hypothetical protein [Terriglobales bacterium]
MAQKLKLKGIEHTEVLTGGYNGWRDLNLPLQEYFPELATIGKKSPLLRQSSATPANPGAQ